MLMGGYGKTRAGRVCGVLHICDGVVLAFFSKHVGHMESNEAEVVAILEVLRIFASSSFQELLIVDSDSLNAITWVLPAKFP